MDRLKSGKLKQISSSVRFVQRKLTVGGRGGGEFHCTAGLQFYKFGFGCFTR